MADRARLKSSNYLASKLMNITDPFQMAITAYALQVAQHGDKELAYSLLKDMAIKSKTLRPCGRHAVCFVVAVLSSSS